MLRAKPISLFGSRGAPSNLTIPELVTEIGFEHLWYGDNVSVISGGVAQINDIGTVGGVHLDDAGVASRRPSYIAEDPDFNGKGSLTFNGIDQYLRNLISDWRGSDTQGEVVIVFRNNTGNTTQSAKLFGSNNHGTGLRAFVMLDVFDAERNLTVFPQGPTANASIRSVGQTMLINKTWVIGMSSNGSRYNLWKSGIDEGKQVVSGADDGDWLNVFTSRDSVTLGAIQQNIKLYGAMTVALVAYRSSELDSSDRTLTYDTLKAYYGTE